MKKTHWPNPMGVTAIDLMCGVFISILFLNVVADAHYEEAPPRPPSGGLKFVEVEIVFPDVGRPGLSPAERRQYRLGVSLTPPPGAVRGPVHSWEGTTGEISWREDIELNVMTAFFPEKADLTGYTVHVFLRGLPAAAPPANLKALIKCSAEADRTLELSAGTFYAARLIL